MTSTPESSGAEDGAAIAPEEQPGETVEPRAAELTSSGGEVSADESGSTDAGTPDEATDAGRSVPVSGEPDPRLVAAHDLALAALREITPATSIGPAAGYHLEVDGVVSLRFENRLAGYPGWYWTVSLAVVDGAEPTVLEAELLPGGGALLAPEWVPWATRLAEYHAQQAVLAESADAAARDDTEDDDLDGADDLDDLDDLDAEDFDEDGSPLLHAGDVDGVDIDELDADDDDDADDSDSDADSDDDADSGDVESGYADSDDDLDDDDSDDLNDDDDVDTGADATTT